MQCTNENAQCIFLFFIYCDFFCCSPLHVAVVKEDLSLVQQILKTVVELSGPVDCFNNLRQVFLQDFVIVITICVKEYHNQILSDLLLLYII